MESLADDDPSGITVLVYTTDFAGINLAKKFERFGSFMWWRSLL
jgi:hypothetical protein